MTEIELGRLHYVIKVWNVTHMAEVTMELEGDIEKPRIIRLPTGRKMIGKEFEVWKKKYWKSEVCNKTFLKCCERKCGSTELSGGCF